MPDDKDDKNPKPLKGVRITTGHVKDERDKDFRSKSQAKQVAKDDWNAIDNALTTLSDELQVATWDGKHKYKELASIDAKTPFLEYAGGAGMLGGIGLMFATAGVGIVVGVGAGLAGGIAHAKDWDVLRDIRRDYLGKKESEFAMDLGNGTLLHVPVTPGNSQALIDALDKARETVNPIKHAERTPQEIIATVKTTMIDYLKTHADGWTVTPIPHKTKTPISGGVDVKGDQAPGGGGAPDSKGIPR